MKKWKLILSLILLSVAVSTLYSYHTYRMFPAIPIAFFVIGVLGVFLSFRVNSYNQALTSIFVIIVATTLLRWFIYSFPISYIGWDPDTFAIWANSIIQTGRTSAVGSGFYESVPGGVLLPAVTSLVTGLHIRLGFGVYALLLGILFPVLSMVFARYIYKDDHRVLIGAAIIGAILAESIRRGYWPIAQNLAILLFQVFVLSLMIYLDTESIESKILLVTLLIAMTYAHKIPLALSIYILIGSVVYLHAQRPIRGALVSLTDWGITPRTTLILLTSAATAVWGSLVWLVASKEVAIIGSVVGLGVTYTLSSSVNIGLDQKMHTSHLLNKIGLLAIITVCAFIIQWVLLTTQLGSFLLYRVIEAGELDPRETVETLRRPVDNGLLDIFFHRTHSMFLLLMSAIVIAWLTVDDRIKRIIPLSSVAFVLLLSPLSITVVSGTGIGSSRLFPNITAIIAGILAVGFVGIPQSKNIKRAAAVLIVILLAFQAFSIVVVPDYPGTERYYLYQEEIDSKEFSHKYLQENVATDTWYATESIEALPGTLTESRVSFRGATQDYFSGDLGEGEHENILYRTDHKVFATSVLTWNPESKLDKTHSVVYNNGKTKIYKK